MALKYVQTLTLYQAGAGNIIGATSVVLTTLTDIYGNAITSMTPFGTKGYITLEPDTTNEEGATFTGITVNANGTTTLTGVSTILAQSPYTETSGLVRQHAGGSKVVVTDNVAFWNTFANINNDQTFIGANSFTQKVGVGAVTSSDLGKAATVDFVNATAVAGAPNASPTVKGIVQEATQAQVLAKTAAGSTGAELYVSPATLPSTLLSDYKADIGSANVYAIAPAPAITAYVIGQTFSFKAANANTAASTLNVNGQGTKAIVNSKGGALVANDILASMLVTVEYDGTSMVMQNPVANTPTTAQTFKFGGTGADGALAVSSGNTNIDCGSAAVVIKNYTSIAITGTGSITFINPHANGTLVILKSQSGGVTLTSSATPMIDDSGIGAAAGTVGLSSILGTNFGTAGTTGGPVGAGGAVPTAAYGSAFSQFLLRYPSVLVGAGGGAGMASANGGTATAGAGGRGGGGLIIECNGAWNFTTASGISVAGKNGTNGAHTSTGFAGGGGGGAGGFFFALYNILTANTGTVTATAGTGGNCSGTGNTMYGGGGGALIAAGNPGTSSGTDATKTGGDGAAGVSLIAANTEFN